MTPKEALHEAKQAVRYDKVKMPSHASGRMAERGYSKRDVYDLIMNAVTVKWQPYHQSWLVEGVTRDGIRARLTFEVLSRGIMIRTVLT